MALTPHQDEELRRIHTLAQFGSLPETMQARYDELRARGEQLVIPEPTLDVQWLPKQRTREDAIDDKIELYDEKDAVDALEELAEQEAHSHGGFDERTIREFTSREMAHASIADMAAFEAAMSGDAYYVASPHTGGFSPSSWYGTN